jgi:hypothetical protein
MSSKDFGYTGGPWGWSPWGNDNRRMRRIARARRKRFTQREVKDES